MGNPGNVICTSVRHLICKILENQNSHWIANLMLESLDTFNPIPTSHGLNQPIYSYHMTQVGRNRVKVDEQRSINLKRVTFQKTSITKCHEPLWPISRFIISFEPKPKPRFGHTLSGHWPFIPNIVPRNFKSVVTFPKTTILLQNVTNPLGPPCMCMGYFRVLNFSSAKKPIFCSDFWRKYLH